MKIIFYTSSLGSGGAERVISVLANNFINKYDVTIVVNSLKNIAYKLDNRIEILELDKKRIKGNLKRNINRIIETKKILETSKPDIIISFLPIPSFRILCLKYYNNIPVIVSDRNNPKEEYKNLISKILMHLLYKKADGFVFQTKEQQLYFSKKIINMSTIISNPLNEIYCGDIIGIVTKEKVIITIGRLVEQKNHKMLINAFSKISKIKSDYILKIYGDGPLKEQLIRQIKNLNLEDKVILCGTTDKIKEELLKAKIFILPSNYEGMPNALMEAMAVGLPCIATDCPCGGPKELIQNEENGILIKVNDEDALVQKTLELLDNEEKMKKISLNAKKIKENLNPQKIVLEWESYIENILKNNFR